MPLPVSDPKAVWPPQNMQPIFARMAQWSAWYSGDLQKLQAAYGGGDIQDSTGFFASDKGGFKATVGRTLQRWFVGEPTRGPDRNTKLPIPIAAEMCQASADLLYADPITVTIGKQTAERAKASVDGKPDPKKDIATPTQARVNALCDETFHATLAEGHELGAALGAHFLRATMDPMNVPDRPFTTVIDADNALPEFSFGRLTAVTFWWVVRVDGNDVWRHLERHELAPNGNGLILHGLYIGTNDALGIRSDLNLSPVTAGLSAQADVNGVAGSFDTRSPGLSVQYVPNQTPNRLWRDDPTGRYLGRSDLDGVEHLMDQLAEVMSAWTRAIRLAKARIFLSKSLLKNMGPGQGMVGNLEQEAYTTLDTLAGKDQPLEQQVQLIQPEVAYEQYQATAQTLVEQILQMAGYSAQTFGVDAESGGMRTATEIESKERRSFLTRDRKIRAAKPAIGAHVEKLLRLDNAFYGGKNVIDEIDVVFPDSVQQTQLALAQTALALYQSESASTKTRVQTIHPDWDDIAVEEEVEEIQAEFQAGPPLMPGGAGGGFPPMPGDQPSAEGPDGEQ